MTTAERQRALIELVEEALDLPEAEQRALIAARAFDAEMHDAALAMCAQRPVSAAQLRTGLPGTVHLREADHAVPERIGAYRVLSKIGRGGMGVVYLGARDAGDFERQVAIKLIHPGMLSPDLIERFNRERQILAALDHPHIARLYDGGKTDGGAPFLVMEYVQGQPLDEWAKDAALAQRLARFRQVLSAVAAAHRNLVIHRDLTPGNILVTADAGVKLIDFGISRPPDDAANPPDGRASTATPGYAAPEAGQRATTLSDIYALGRLLAGLTQAESQPELAAIAARASAADPAARYPTVEALDADVAAFESGFPVTAADNGRAYRMRKFIRRNRLGVGLAACAAAVLLAGVLALNQAYRSERAARQAADMRFGEVRELSKFMLFDLYDRLEPVPGNTASLNAIADTSRSYLGRLSQIDGAPRAVRLETAQAHHRLAIVMGGTRDANLGRREEAYALLQTGIAQLEALHREAPADHAATQELADAYRTRAAIEYVGLDDNDAAQLSATLAANLYRDLAAAGWQVQAMLLAEIGARTEHAVTHGWDDRAARGVAEFATIDRALHRIEREYGISEATLAVRGNMEAHYAATLGKAIFASGATDYAPSVAIGERAIATYDRLLAVADDPALYQRSVITALYEQAILLSGVEGGDRASLPLLERAERIARDLLARDPEDQGINRRLTSIIGQYTIALAYSGEGLAAWAKGAEVIARKQALLALEPDNEARQRELVDTLVLVGEAHQITGDPATACRHFRSARGLADAFQRRTGRAFDDVWGTIDELAQRIEQVC